MRGESVGKEGREMQSGVYKQGVHANAAAEMGEENSANQSARENSGVNVAFVPASTN